MAAVDYVVHTVADGDTIQLIGQKYEVDWTEIVELNGLEYPYVWSDATDESYKDIDTVATFGAQILIPAGAMRFPLKTNNSVKEIEKYSFGCDLDLFTAEKGDHYNVVNLEIEGQLNDNNKGDLKLAEGLRNLQQQLIIRLGTEKGSLLLHPDFGSNIIEYIGTRVSVELLTKVKLEIRECLMSDFRVADVDNIQVVYSDKAVHVDCDVYAVGVKQPMKLSETYYK